jgi:hypothetical protein
MWMLCRKEWHELSDATGFRGASGNVAASSDCSLCGVIHCMTFSAVVQALALAKETGGDIGDVGLLQVGD